MAKMNSIHVIPCATNLGWTLQQFNLKNVFLHRYLEEDVYMEILPGFSSQMTKGKVCKSNPPGPGLIDFLKLCWSLDINKVRLIIPCSSRQVDGKITVLIVYVDYIVITGNDENEATKLKAKLAKKFEIKDFGPLRYFLGIKVTSSNNDIIIS